MGQPPKYKTNEELEKKIQAYFDGEDCSMTITGLALHLGFCSRQSFYDYEKNDKYSYTIKRARLTIEEHYEKNLVGNSPTGSIFALKNFGWKDKLEVDQNNKHSFDTDPFKSIRDNAGLNDSDK